MTDKDSFEDFEQNFSDNDVVKYALNQLEDKNIIADIEKCLSVSILFAMDVRNICNVISIKNIQSPEEYWEIIDEYKQEKKDEYDADMTAFEEEVGEDYINNAQIAFEYPKDKVIQYAFGESDPDTAKEIESLMKENDIFTDFVEGVKLTIKEENLTSVEQFIKYQTQDANDFVNKSHHQVRGDIILKKLGI